MPVKAGTVSACSSIEALAERVLPCILAAIRVVCALGCPEARISVIQSGEIDMEVEGQIRVEEYKALRNEIHEEERYCDRLLTQAFLVAAGVGSWYLTNKQDAPDEIAWLPAIVTAAMAFRAFCGYVRMGVKGRYLRKSVEKRLWPNGDLGWETHFRRTRHNVSIAIAAMWIGIVLCSIVFAMSYERHLAGHVLVWTVFIGSVAIGLMTCVMMCGSKATPGTDSKSSTAA